LKKARFLIAAHPYNHQSAGIVVLHELCDTLIRLGYEAYIIFFYGGNIPNYNWGWSNHSLWYGPGLSKGQIPDSDLDAFTSKLLREGIVIYPEVVTGNPLGASQVVRYFLNKDGGLTGIPTKYLKTDYKLSFSKVFFPHADGYLFKLQTSPHFHSKNMPFALQRNMDTTYVGKGGKYTQTFRVSNSILITKGWPEDKEQLGLILRNTRYFFTWDSVSSTNIDAVLCGAVPVVMQWMQSTPAELDGTEMGPFPYCLAHIDGGEVSIEFIESEFIEKRDLFLKTTDKLISSWDQRVAKIADNILEYFNMN
jgi:hypothetical protein